MDTVYLVLVLVWGLVWGACTRQNVLDKGYEDEGLKYFFIGFFLGLIGFILAYAKPDLKKEYMDNQFRQMIENQNKIMNSQMAAPPPRAEVNDGWRCFCGAMNREYEGSCHSCGRTQAEAKKASKEKEAHNSEEAIPNQTPTTDQLREFKAMLDEGLITEEEYNAKKKQLLGL